MLNALSHRRLKEVLQEELKNKWQERRQAALEALRNKEQEAASRAGNEAGGAQATKRQALPLTSATIGRQVSNSPVLSRTPLLTLHSLHPQPRAYTACAPCLQLELCVHTGLIGNTRHQHAALRSIARSRHMSWLVQKGSIAGGASAEDVPKIVAKQEDQIQKRLSRPFLPPGWQRELIVDPKEAQAQQDAAVASLKSMERALKNVSGDLTATLARHLTTAAIIICEGLRTG